MKASVLLVTATMEIDGPFAIRPATSARARVVRRGDRGLLVSDASCTTERSRNLTSTRRFPRKFARFLLHNPVEYEIMSSEHKRTPIA
jgi:hypothetical protein